jgi:release factor glutamine methyltransferase
MASGPVTPDSASGGCADDRRAAIIARLRAAGCVFAEDEADLLIAAGETPAELTAMVERRVGGEPLEYVLGWAEFCGLRVIVEPGVFVPRRRTEFLVREASALVAPGAVVLDLCCGSGAVGVAVIAGNTLCDAGSDQAELYAADVEPAAVRCARRNVEPIGGHVFEGDLYAPLPADLRGRVTVLVVNAPYVPSDAVPFMPPEARDYEPLVALDGGSDGLDVQRRVIAEAPQWLAPGAHLLIETSDRQATRTAEAFAAAGLSFHICHDDETESSVVIGSR